MFLGARTLPSVSGNSLDKPASEKLMLLYILPDATNRPMLIKRITRHSKKLHVLYHYANMSGAKDAPKRLSRQAQSTPAMVARNWSISWLIRVGRTAQVCSHSYIFPREWVWCRISGCQTPTSKEEGCHHIAVSIHLWACASSFWWDYT